MNLFKFTKRQKREKQINWLTVKCDGCSEDGKPYIVLVEQDDIKVRPRGYKGQIQMFVICPKCGKQLVIPEEKVPKKVFNYVLEKAYVSADCFQF